MASTLVALPLRIEFGRLARDTRIWLGDTDISSRVVSVSVTANAEDEGGLTRVWLECVTMDGDSMTLTSPVKVVFDGDRQ